MRTIGVGLSKRYLDGREGNIHDFWDANDVKRFKVGDFAVGRKLFVVVDVITDKNSFPQGFSSRSAEVVILLKEVPCAVIEKKRSEGFFENEWIAGVDECEKACDCRASCPFRKLYVSSPGRFW